MSRYRSPRPRRRGLARTLLLVTLGAGLLVLAAWLMSSGSPPPVAPAEGPPPQGPMTEEERLAYIRAFVRIDGLAIGPDLRPDSDEPVPGLLRVQGEVVNEGEREIERVFLEVFPMDDAGAVLAAHVEDVVRRGGALEPGQRRAFRFTIPDKKAFTGRFDHGLR
ncbi:MAG: FxLYD domain-containing protein [Myxococcota bacterium]